MIRRTTTALATAALALLAPAIARADFGFVPGSAKVSALDGEGRPLLRAGAHPDKLTIEFELAHEANGTVVGGEMRDVIINLPPGFVGNPQSVPVCTRLQFEGETPRCPGSSQVGVLRATATGLGETIDPIYNIEPPPGKAAELGFSAYNFLIPQLASVRTEDGYGITVASPNIPVEIESVKAVIWGDPADTGNDPERYCASGKSTADVIGCSTDAAKEAFLTLPTSCGPFDVTIEADSRSTPGDYVRETPSLTDAGGNPAPLVGCQSVPFAPTVDSTPTSSASESASGLFFQLALPNQGVTEPEQIAETEPVKTAVALPAGITANPAAAGGLSACTPEQYAAATVQPGSGCPEASKIGTLIAKTPLLEEAIEGSFYLASPHNNPFGSLLALYIVARVPERGILVKQAGEVKADPLTGQLTATFDKLPPLPYSSFQVRLRQGPRAPLITPAGCGEYNTVAKLYPYSQPDSPLERVVPFTITTGAGGAACTAPANTPAFAAGSLYTMAGAYSPFVMSLKREDGNQRFAAVDLTLPPGLTGKLAGIQKCSEAQIAQAKARGGPNQGALELAHPSCPASSQVGVAQVAAGAGSQPYQVQGKVYLAGPYKGAPFSLVIDTPAVAGPFDLGNVAVRAGLYVDPHTAQVTVLSDPIPTILEGIPLDVRSIDVEMSRPQFTLNPTSCEAMRIAGRESSVAGQVAPLSSRFRVGGCAGLPFKPGFAVSTKAHHTRRGGAYLHVRVTSGRGQANIAKVHVVLPVKLPARNSTLKLACTEAQFAANPAGCPEGSFVGGAVAHTPLLEKRLSGPAIFVSHGGRGFPDLDVVLQGEGITIILTGNTFISKKGITTSTFATVPDVPVSRFEMTLPTGSHSALAGFGNFCTRTKTIEKRVRLRRKGHLVRRKGHVVLKKRKARRTVRRKLVMPTTITGQNGAVVERATRIEVEGCEAGKGKANHHGKRGHGKHNRKGGAAHHNGRARRSGGHNGGGGR